MEGKGTAGSSGIDDLPSLETWRGARGDRTPELLVVDDDPAIKVIVEGALIERRIDVAAVSSGEDALRWMNYREPDAVLLDIRLPGADGIEIFGALRDRGYERPVLLMSSFPRARTRARRALGDEPFEVLTKPIGIETIEAIVDEILSPGGP